MLLLWFHFQQKIDPLHLQSAAHLGEKVYFKQISQFLGSLCFKGTVDVNLADCLFKNGMSSSHLSEMRISA